MRDSKKVKPSQYEEKNRREMKWDGMILLT
jgi:hypothetical protein